MNPFPLPHERYLFLINASLLFYKGPHIYSSFQELKQQAKNGLLKADQPQNAMFTISNLENFEIKSFTAILNPPQSATLTVGNSQTLVTDDYKLMQVVNFTLCCDGRVVDEQLASEWLTVLKSLIEKPLQMAL